MESSELESSELESLGLGPLGLEPSEAVRVHVRALGVTEADTDPGGWQPLAPHELHGVMVAIEVAGAPGLFAATTYELVLAAVMTRGRWESQAADFPPQYTAPRGINHLLLVRPRRRRPSAE
ncbi:MAG: hypothetical protein OXI79_01405 [Gammaproteobacteria bacterium]|nr:hypothetical protein [Gammaproteobacteria bacterium]